MKLLMITCHFEFGQQIVEILDRHELRDYAQFSMIEGRDHHGKHFGSQVFPGNLTALHAQVPEETVDALLDDLKEFRQRREAHRHVQALVLPVERRLESGHQ